MHPHLDGWCIWMSIHNYIIVYTGAYICICLYNAWVGLQSLCVIIVFANAHVAYAFKKILVRRNDCVTL